MISHRIKKIRLVNEFYFFRIIFQISSYFLYSFYLILLFKHTNDFKVLILDSVIFYAGAWMGFIFGSFTLQRIGYVNTFRLSFILTALSGITIAITISQIGLLFPILSLFRGFGRGIFWPVNNGYLLREFNVTERGSIISIATSISLLLDIAFPILVGSLLSQSGDYALIYLIGSVILLLATFLRFGYNKTPKTEITSGEITAILSDKTFIKYALLTIMSQISWIIIIFTMLILPYIFTQSEGDTGILLSIVNLVAAITAFSQRNSIVRRGTGLGKFGYVFGIIASIILIYFWNIYGLTISMVLIILSTSLKDPLESKIVTYLNQLILGKQRNQSAIEMNMIIETIYLIGRLSGLVIFLIAFITISDPSNVFKIFVLGSSLWSVVNIYFLLKLIKKDKKGLDDIPSPELEPV